MIEFWFSVGSTYTYLSVMRLPAVEKLAGVQFAWRPFNVREIMLEMNNIPFSTKPVKAAYMWRDIERRARMHGLSFTTAPPYPPKDLPRANRIAVLAARQGWIQDYVQATYRHWFEDHLLPGNMENIDAMAADLGRDAGAIVREADEESVVSELAQLTQRAREKGVFGAHSWVAGNELFWGDDRLEDAIAWSRHGFLTPALPGSPR